MSPPDLGGLRVSRAAGPGPSCAREYGKDQVVMQSPARHRNYTTPRFKMASMGFRGFRSQFANGARAGDGVTVMPFAMHAPSL